jgi:hypothetical protein
MRIGLWEFGRTPHWGFGERAPREPDVARMWVLGPIAITRRWDENEDEDDLLQEIALICAAAALLICIFGLVTSSRR